MEGFTIKLKGKGKIEIASSSEVVFITVCDEMGIGVQYITKDQAKQLGEYLIKISK